MIGIVLNTNNASINDLQITANKLLLISNQVIITSDDQNVQNYFNLHSSSKVVTQQRPFNKNNCLSEIYAASLYFPEQSDFVTLSTEFKQLKPVILTNLTNNSNCYAATIKQNYYSISHFNINNYDLSQYLNLDDFNLKQFITQEIQCLPLIFSTGNMF
ncbi:hypothetical protein [Companilactobacillus keshanensis]|uniref:Uncharacterized protein n=1 Tax=Companilactobacillus keshanensis TaxID=2486003 RepID=A0ABW4BS93_9LACO|nr:hypothetical protein [Companilactobacillus keshanensis]